MKKNGFSLTELLVVMTIVAVMALILVGILNPAALINKAGDSSRKGDLNRFKITFEEYFNDKGRYPNYVNSWNVNSGCGETINNVYDVSKYIRKLPCDPDGEVYKIYTTTNTFKVMTNLKNKSDKDIPVNWYGENDYTLSGGLTVNDVNYGVSSPNIRWYESGGEEEEEIPDPSCNTLECWLGPGCNKLGVGISCPAGGDCYYGNNAGCIPLCRASGGCIGH